MSVVRCHEIVPATLKRHVLVTAFTDCLLSDDISMKTKTIAITFQLTNDRTTDDA